MLSLQFLWLDLSSYVQMSLNIFFLFRITESFLWYYLVWILLFFMYLTEIYRVDNVVLHCASNLCLVLLRLHALNVMDLKHNSLCRMDSSSLLAIEGYTKMCRKMLSLYPHQQQVEQQDFFRTNYSFECGKSNLCVKIKASIPKIFFYIHHTSINSSNYRSLLIFPFHFPFRYDPVTGFFRK